jgi:hypothetical protein
METPVFTRPPFCSSKRWIAVMRTAGLLKMKFENLVKKSKSSLSWRTITCESLAQNGANLIYQNFSLLVMVASTLAPVLTLYLLAIAPLARRLARLFMRLLTELFTLILTEKIKSVYLWLNFPCLPGPQHFSVSWWSFDATHHGKTWYVPQSPCLPHPDNAVLPRAAKFSLLAFCWCTWLWGRHGTR